MLLENVHIGKDIYKKIPIFPRNLDEVGGDCLGAKPVSPLRIAAGITASATGPLMGK
jgi:hypothetical protein